MRCSGLFLWGCAAVRFFVTPKRRPCRLQTTVQTVRTEYVFSDPSISNLFLTHICASSYKRVFDMFEFLFIFIDRPHKLIA